MSHHHHDQHHHHDHQHSAAEMSLEEKIAKLLEHWIKHNNDHAQTYQGWADQAKQNHMEAVAAIIDEAAQMNLAMNEKFEQARKLIHKKG